MLEINHATKEYSVWGGKKERGMFASVNDVSLTLLPDRAYSLVGESGSGKSTLAMMMAAVLRPTSGNILFDGKDIGKLSVKKRRLLRSELQLVLQDSQGALDPRKTIYHSIAEPLRNLRKISRKAEQSAVYEIAEKVQLDRKLLDRKPNELSGGQQNRVCIARAMGLSPKFIIFDESVSGLDVTVQKKVLDLIFKLREEYHSTYLFITHDIDAALYMAEDIFVMKGGCLIEETHGARSYYDFHHDYSKKLIEALPPKSPYER